MIGDELLLLLFVLFLQLRASRAMKGVTEHMLVSMPRASLAVSRREPARVCVCVCVCVLVWTLREQYGFYPPATWEVERTLIASATRSTVANPNQSSPACPGR